MKKSIVLLITLAIITAIAALIAISLNIVDERTKSLGKKHFLVQTLTIFHNVVDILKRKSKDINSSEGFELLLLSPIELKSDNIKLQIKFQSAAQGINPNNFIKIVNNKKVLDPNMILLFDRILQIENVQNSELFLAMIEDTFDSNFAERMPGSEIALYDKRFKQGKIENFKKFSMIIDRYVKLTEDQNIYNIPWKKILSFYSKHIDFNYIKPKLLSYMLPYIEEETIQRITTNKEQSFKNINDLPLSREYKEELKKYHISFFVPVLEGDMQLSQDDYNSSIHFIYDIKEKKVRYIEEKIF